MPSSLSPAAHGSNGAGVVGNGTPASCADAALNAALAGGGTVTFDCGGAAMIDVSTGTGTKTIEVDTTVDGDGAVSISGGYSVGVFVVNSGVNRPTANSFIWNPPAGSWCLIRVSGPLIRRHPVPHVPAVGRDVVRGLVEMERTRRSPATEGRWLQS